MPLGCALTGLAKAKGADMEWLDWLTGKVKDTAGDVKDYAVRGATSFNPMDKFKPRDDITTWELAQIHRDVIGRVFTKEQWEYYVGPAVRRHFSI